MDSITIVIVEDIEDIREALQDYINSNSGFKVLQSFSSAEDALENLPALQADIVIMDINLPGISGIECIRIIKDECPRSQFMMFTIFENDEKVFESLWAGASGYLLKKTSFPQILDALKELHQGGAPMSAHIARKLLNHMNSQDRSLPESSLLTKTENEILHHLSNGLLYKEISGILQTSTETIRKHIHKIYDKLHVQNRTDAIDKPRKKS